LILTSDGLIATTAAVQNKPQLTVKLMDGTLVQNAKVVAADPASPLVFVKIDASRLPTASFGNPNDLQLSQRMIALLPSIGENQSQDAVAYLTGLLRDNDYNAVFSSERLARTFSIAAFKNLPEGSVILDATGSVQGLYSGSGIIPANVISDALSSYFNNSSKIVRNQLGINYQYIPKVLAAANAEKQGIVLKRSDKPAVLPGSPAQKAGLLEGDIIYAVDDTQIDLNNNFETLLSRRKPGDTVKFSVQRGKDLKTINVVLGISQ